MNDDDTWERYTAGIARIRAGLLTLPIAADPAGRAQIDRLMIEASAAAYNLVIAPDPAHPRFLTQTVFAPGCYDWLLPNPDFLYRYAFLEGRCRYRLSGMRGSSLFLDLQTMAGFFGDPALKLLDSHRLDDMTAADGSIDIMLSANPPRDGSAWIRLDPDAVTTVIVREAFIDWSSEGGAALHLSPLDPILPRRDDALAIAGLIDAAIRMIDFCMSTFGPHFCQAVLERCGANRFVHVETGRDEDAANPGVAYVPAAFEIGADEALMLSFRVPDARYWSIHLADRLSRTLDYTSRLSSLNGGQAVIDADGIARVVLTARDPGTANWLDCGELDQGMMLLRWYGARNVELPTVQRIKWAAIGGTLPSGSVSVAPAERQAVIAERRAAIMTRYER